MTVQNTDHGYVVRLSNGEARILVEELGDLPARGSPKVVQLHKHLFECMQWAARGAVGARDG